MKGIIFTSLNDMIEEEYGLQTWDNLLTTVKPESKGIYAAGGVYNDTELFEYVNELSQLVNKEPSQIIEDFGIYLFPILAKKYPASLPKDISFIDFMKSVDRIIHFEVNKLHPEALLPTISYEQPSPNKLAILYRSPRKLCALAVGLTKGAAAHFKVRITIQQPICMHQGADHCRLEITVGR